MAENYEEIHEELLDKHSDLGGKNMANSDMHPVVNGFYPTPSAKDYKRGYFYRYFVVHYTGKTVEVSQKYMKDFQNKLPKIYTTYSVQWFISDKSKVKTEYGMDSPNAADRNRFLVQRIPNPALSEYLGKNWEEFKA